MFLRGDVIGWNMFKTSCYVFMKFFICHCEVDKNLKLLLYPVDENVQILSQSVDKILFIPMSAINA